MPTKKYLAVLNKKMESGKVRKFSLRV